MKKITAMIMALTIAALSLTGCSSDEGTSSTTEQNISGLSSESEAFVTTSTPEIVTEETTKDTSPITADTREELAIGLLEAVLTDDKDTAKRYNVSSKIYASIQTALEESKEKAEIGEEEILTVNDFEIYFTGPNSSQVGDDTDTVYMTIISQKLSSIELGTFTILYDFDTEKYMFKKTSDRYNYATFADSNAEHLVDYGYETQYEYMSSKLKNGQLVEIS